MTLPSSGAAPAGASDEESASRAVQSMFNRIAPRYDLLNHLLSANVDRIWWRRTARTFSVVLKDPDAQILDMCCGTGDMTLALLRLRPENSQPVIALDFARAMLERAREKFSALGFSARAVFVEGDALRMPFDSNSMDLITTAFGFRNLANYTAGLREMHRVLKPGGEIGILDFSEPKGALGWLYRFYFRNILPGVGRIVSGARKNASEEAPYSYLPESVHRFPSPAEMLALMRSCGFDHPTWTPYTFGIAGLYRAVKP